MKLVRLSRLKAHIDNSNMNDEDKINYLIIQCLMNRYFKCRISIDDVDGIASILNMDEKVVMELLEWED